MTEREAVIKAKNTVKDFFEICQRLSLKAKRGTKDLRPFKLHVSVLDYNKYKPNGTTRENDKSES